MTDESTAPRSHFDIGRDESQTSARPPDLIIFDLDWTLIRPKDPTQRFIADADDYEWLPRRRFKLIALVRRGIRFAIATNQASVAFGIRTVADVERMLETVKSEGEIEIVKVCFTHPNATLDAYRKVRDLRRKPFPAMLWEVMTDAEVLDARRVLYVGDLETDRQAAARAGVAFLDAETFFAY